MNKVELVEKIVAGLKAQDVKAKKGEVTTAVDMALDIIKDELVKGGKVKFVGFGEFSVTERGARDGRNPKTGEAVRIEASKSPKFKAGKSLKDAVKGK